MFTMERNVEVMDIFAETPKVNFVRRATPGTRLVTVIGMEVLMTMTMTIVTRSSLPGAIQERHPISYFSMIPLVMDGIRLK
jgi:hypothetical protein